MQQKLIFKNSFNQIFDAEQSLLGEIAIETT